jgi:F-type H+-transporting ATPase subunit b
LEDRLCEVFIRRLSEMDAKTKPVLAEAFKTAIEPALVRSAFELSADQRSLIQHALNETFSADPAAQLRTGIQIRFETAPELISGIELATVTGQKLAWSIADYLLSLEKSLDELLKDQDKPLAKVMPELEVNSP